MCLACLFYHRHHISFISMVLVYFVRELADLADFTPSSSQEQSRTTLVEAS